MITYTDETEIEIAEGLKAQRQKYSIEYESFELAATETISPFGIFTSLDGHFGAACAIQLANALAYGRITQAYSDEADLPTTPTANRYQDLTAEWYTDKAVEIGLLEARLQKRIGPFDADLIDMDEVERLGRKWLELPLDRD